MDFNNRLMEHRKRLGMSQEELGYNLGVSRQTVSKWELGETTPEMSKLIAMSELFEVSIDNLVKGEDNVVFRGKGVYEYKSKQTLWGLPLVHIHTGSKRGGKICRAKGIVAIGDVATGIVAVGGLSVGVVALGGLGLGIIGLGGLAAGLISFGGVSLGGLAFGGMAVGYMAIGGGAFGINAIGGSAIARDIALGDYAKATIAIGRDTEGVAVFGMGITPSEFRTAVSKYLPNAMDWVVRIFEKFLM